MSQCIFEPFVHGEVLQEIEGKTTQCLAAVPGCPTNHGRQTGAIYIPGDAPDSPQVIQLGGTGIGSTLQFSTLAWTFAAHRVGETSGNGVIYAYNAAAGLVTFQYGQILEQGLPSDNFHLIDDTCGPVLKPYTSCALTFNFRPSTPGEKTATLNLNDNSANGPFQISLSGYAY